MGNCMDSSSAAAQRQRSSKRERMAAADREWTDLPCELLPPIADRLGLIELLSFRGVCKEWKSASSSASAEIEALPNHEPWLLIYGENNSQCTLVTDSGKKYSINIPELDEATCLASSQGWLLLFRDGSMFFFCPFSRAKIDLPGQLHCTQTSDHLTALFSAPPTSKDCVVCVSYKPKKTEEILELYVIRRGETAWKKHKHNVAGLKKIDSAAYCDGHFYFFDNAKIMVRFTAQEKRILVGKVSYAESEHKIYVPLRFSSIRELYGMKVRLGIEERLPVFFCGTIVNGEDVDRIVPHEYAEMGNEPADVRRSLKGVWLQPRFHQIDQNQSW